MRNIIILTAASLLLAAAFYYWWNEALGICLGMLWGSINLYMIKQLMQCVLIAENRNLLKILAYILIKFPLLYFLGYGLLSMPYFSPWSLLIGFSLILAVSTQNWFWNIQQKLNQANKNPT